MRDAYSQYLYVNAYSLKLFFPNVMPLLSYFLNDCFDFETIIKYS